MKRKRNQEENYGNGMKKSCCRFLIPRKSWARENILNHPMGVFLYQDNNIHDNTKYHALFPFGRNERKLLGCFKTAEEAAKTWDQQLRKEVNDKRYDAFNFPLKEDEKHFQDIIKDKFNFYRTHGFPYFPIDKEWRKGQLDLLLSKKENVNAIWISDNNILQQEDHDIAPGNQLCWSYHPHSFEIRKTVLKGKDRPSAMDTFHNDEKLLKCIRSCIEYRGDFQCSPLTLVGECKFLQGSWILNFQPIIAAAIYARYGGTNGIVYDSSAGWGGRMLGARLAGVKKYIACEPNTATYHGLLEMAELIKEDMIVDIHMEGSENFITSEEVDMAFTSPPYFNLELYSNEPTQSHIKFPSFDQWCDGFLKRTIENTWKVIKKGGYMLININSCKMFLNQGFNFEEYTKKEAIHLGASLENTLWMQKMNQTIDKAEPIFVFKK
jgi:hypothetical protein